MRTPPYVESPVAHRAGTVPDMAPGRDHGSCRRPCHGVLPRRRPAGVWPRRRSCASSRIGRGYCSASPARARDLAADRLGAQGLRNHLRAAEDPASPPVAFAGARRQGPSPSASVTAPCAGDAARPTSAIGTETARPLPPAPNRPIATGRRGSARRRLAGCLPADVVQGHGALDVCPEALRRQPVPRQHTAHFRRDALQRHAFPVAQPVIQ